ncbi:PH domain-containing protein [Arthrobacter sp. ATA002]|uniref:PH domain-containing protein n=1 Tax=Arthrobacter sp. ATA002 TaxID=2991715 RepID=UPI0022A7441E|nr:PH domain-containing protein [Arthrobacter sp. ATA002]WAP50588.1 PH domain-containing protein [Arthrobacter sp. ATA002]
MAIIGEVENSGLKVRPPALRVDRRAPAWWMVRNILVCGVPLALLIAGAVLWDPARAWLIAPIVGMALVLAAKAGVEPWWRYRVHRWEVTDRATYASTGWLVVEWRVAPTSRIQTVDAVRGPLEQLFGLATLRVTTASSSGAINIRGLDHRTAEEAAARLAVVAELSEGDAT